MKFNEGRKHQSEETPHLISGDLTHVIEKFTHYLFLYHICIFVSRTKYLRFQDDVMDSIRNLNSTIPREYPVGRRECRRREPDKSRPANDNDDGQIWKNERHAVVLGKKLIIIRV